ncbi:hypothetical protein NQ317_011935 [Molorchus minor]|uniref:acid phosphatase n=1 Tax=Molorchus minor TaxID=1323400 RepID=A0ABQ9IVK1_9CUCU|nr:hypothetical protein NQ317_011935 [Molorchus minor]
MSPWSYFKSAIVFQLVLFRHGERTGINSGTYPKDPHGNETYYPYGPGQVTKHLGRDTEFLWGELYHPDILEAWSSNTDRTKVSLMLVLAGLFPPVADEIWDDQLIWQPIPFNQLARKEDKIFFSIASCPKYNIEYENYIQTDNMIQIFEKHKKLFQLLSEETGWNVTSFRQVFHLYIGLKVKEEWGLTLPEWTKQVYPQPIQYLAEQEYLISTNTTNLRRIISGYLLKKIITDSISKLNNPDSTNNKKLYLYSGHEFNLAALLATLEIFNDPHVPPYGSYITIEIHKINGIDGVKESAQRAKIRKLYLCRLPCRLPHTRIFYQNYTSEEPHLLSLPECEEFCEFGKFVALVEKYFPGNDTCETVKECNDNSILHK